MTKERPLPYSKEMILAKLANRKFQTRRNKSLKTINENPDRYHFMRIIGRDALFIDKDNPGGDTLRIRCPYGCVGDILWVQEDYSLEVINSKDSGKIYVSLL